MRPSDPIEYERSKYAPTLPDREILEVGDLSDVTGKNIVEIDGDGVVYVSRLSKSTGSYPDGAAMIVRPANAETTIIFQDADDEGVEDGNLRLPEGKDTPELSDPSHQAKFIFNEETGLWTFNSSNVMVLAVEQLDEIMDEVNAVEVGISEIPMTMSFELTPLPNVGGAIVAINEIAMTMAFELTPPPVVISGLNATYSITGGVADQSEISYTYPLGTNFVEMQIIGSLIHKHQGASDAYSLFQDSMFPFQTNTQGNDPGDNAWNAAVDDASPGTPPGDNSEFLRWYTGGITGDWKTILYEGVSTREEYVSLTHIGGANTISIEIAHCTPAIHFNNDIGWIPLVLLRTLQKTNAWSACPKAYLENSQVQWPAWINVGTTPGGAPIGAGHQNALLHSNLMANTPGNPVDPSIVKTELEKLRDDSSPNESLISTFGHYTLPINMTTIEQNLGVNSSGRTGVIKFNLIGIRKDPTIHQSTLNEGAQLAAGDTTITLADASTFPSSGHIRIEDEIISYSGKSSNDLTGCSRGQDGTSDVAHDDGTAVESMLLTGSHRPGYVWGRYNLSFTAI